MLAITIGFKDLALSSVWLGNKIILHANQVGDSIDRSGHHEREIPYGILKIGNKMSVDFGRNADETIGMNPLRTIGRPRPNNTRTMQKSCNILNSIRET